MDYASVRDKTLVAVCTGCRREAFVLDGWWEHLARKCDGDLEKMAARLKCVECGAQGRIDVREKLPPREYSAEDYELLAEIGAVMRSGRKAKKRSDG